jgi:hypothetical protein
VLSLAGKRSSSARNALAAIAAGVLLLLVLAIALRIMGPGTM